MTNAISRNRKAVLGIAASMLLAGGAAFTIGTVAPNFADSFAASASDVATGEKSAVTLVVEKAESGVGVLGK